jgi:hypothetical protein
MRTPLAFQIVLLRCELSHNANDPGNHTSGLLNHDVEMPTNETHCGTAAAALP